MAKGNLNFQVSDMREHFEKYLKAQGYKEKTPSGQPSTIYQYIKSVDEVCQREGLSWTLLSRNISTIVKIYGIGGEKQNLGEKSHNTVISALKQFQEFVQKTHEF